MNAGGTVLVAIHHSSSLSRNKDFRLNQHVPPKFPPPVRCVGYAPHDGRSRAPAIGFTMYVFIAMRYEERDLARRYGSS